MEPKIAEHIKVLMIPVRKEEEEEEEGEGKSPSMSDCKLRVCSGNISALINWLRHRVISMDDAEEILTLPDEISGGPAYHFNVKVIGVKPSQYADGKFRMGIDTGFSIVLREQ